MPRYLTSPISIANFDSALKSFMRNDQDTTFTGFIGTSTYIDITYNSTGAGGIRFRQGNGYQQGYLYGAGNGEFGMLDDDGSWAVRARTGSNYNLFYCNGNAEWYVHTSYCTAPGSLRSPIFYDSNNTTYYANPNSTSTSMRLRGDVVTYYSDERLKDIHGKIENPLDKISSLNGFYYTPNEKAQKLGYKNKKQVGVSAQEVQKVLPEVVKDAAVGKGYKTVAYDRLVPLLIESIKELNTRLESLNKQIEERDNAV